MRKVLLVGLMMLFMVGGCAVDCNCDEKKSETKAKYGQPEEISTFTSGNYTSIEWWYWSKGICITFTSDSPDICCDVSTYTFSPMAASDKSLVELNLVDETSETRGVVSP